MENEVFGCPDKALKLKVMPARASINLNLKDGEVRGGWRVRDEETIRKNLLNFVKEMEEKFEVKPTPQWVVLRPNFFWKPGFQNKRGTGSPIKLNGQLQHNNHGDTPLMVWERNNGQNHQIPALATSVDRYEERNFFLRALTLISWYGCHPNVRYPHNITTTTSPPTQRGTFGH
jgi:hypothetical protein